MSDNGKDKESPQEGRGLIPTASNNDIIPGIGSIPEGIDVKVWVAFTILQEVHQYMVEHRSMNVSAACIAVDWDRNEYYRWKNDPRIQALIVRRTDHMWASVMRGIENAMLSGLAHMAHLAAGHGENEGASVRAQQYLTSLAERIQGRLEDQQPIDASSQVQESRALATQRAIWDMAEERHKMTMTRTTEKIELTPE
jgi:hypothetical protein